MTTTANFVQSPRAQTDLVLSAETPPVPVHSDQRSPCTEDDIHQYEIAAEQGSSDAMTALGYCYGAGAGVKQDLALSAWWYRRAADHGSVAAMINLSVYCKEGTGIRKDNRESARWVRRAMNSATHTE